MEFTNDDAIIRAAQSLKKFGTLNDPTERKRQQAILQAKFVGTQIACRQHVLDPTALVIHKFMNHKSTSGQLRATLLSLSQNHPEAWITIHNHTPNGVCLQSDSCLTYSPLPLKAATQELPTESIPLSGPLEKPFLLEF